MSVARFLAGLPAVRPNPRARAVTPATSWRLLRTATGAPGAGWEFLRRVEGRAAAARAEVEVPAPGEFRPGDLVALRAEPAADGTRPPGDADWYVPEHGRPVAVPAPSALRGLGPHALDRAAVGLDWPALWALADGEVLLDAARAAGVAPLALTRVEAALVGRHLRSSVGADAADAGEWKRLGRDYLRVVEALESPDPAAALKALRASLNDARWAAIVGSARWSVSGAIATLAGPRRRDEPSVSARLATAAARAGGEAAAAAERAAQADVVRALLPLRAVCEALAELRRR